MKQIVLTIPFRILANAAMVFFLVSAASPARAQTDNQNPIEITATKTVEWLRNQNQYVARENVVVTQGKMTINTDLLTADYRDSAQSSMEIWQLTAEGNVQIKDATNTAYGDRAVYDVTTGIATLTGKDLKIVSPEQTVTAHEKMEYHANERLAKAMGKVKVVRGQNTLTADTLTAFFKDNAAPATTPASASSTGGSLDRLEAEGNVVITTPTETLRGQKGVYNAATNTAAIKGKVKIERGENLIEGERAEVDLTTNISKMFGSDKPGGRVRGVFFPGTEKKLPEQPVMKSPTTATPQPARVSPAIQD